MKGDLVEEEVKGNMVNAERANASKSAAGFLNTDYMNEQGFYDEGMQNYINKADVSSPKSAHNPIHKDAFIGSDGDSSNENKDNFGETVEEQRKGLWRSIFGYFRGPNKDSKSQKSLNILDQSDEKDEQLVMGIQANQTDEQVADKPAQLPINPKYEIDLQDEANSDRYDSEYGAESSGQQAKQDSSEINMSICLHVFKQLKPQTYSDMKEIFEEHKVSYDMMCQRPKEIIQDANLVVQIDRNFYNWETGAPMIMSYLTFQQPLPIDQTS